MTKMNEALLFMVVVCTLGCIATARLALYQGRVLFTGHMTGVQVYQVEGVASVELSGMNPPFYYFDCNTTSGDGSNLQWTRMSTQYSFEVENIPNGRRLNVAGLSYPDLDVYFCTDPDTGDTASLNITSDNPAIVPANANLDIKQGLSISLQVYVSGYPLIVGSDIRWFRPDSTRIQTEDETFVDGNKQLLLTNVQPSDAGTYTIMIVKAQGFGSILRVSTTINLEVYVTPFIESHPQPVLSAQEWSAVTLSCIASGNPAPQITWEREDHTELPLGAETRRELNESSFVSKATSYLTLPTTRYDDRGRYKCVAMSNQPIISTTRSSYAEITVTPALWLDYSINSNAAMRLDDSNIIFISYTSNLIVNCYGSGNLRWSSSTGSDIPSDSSNQLSQQFNHTRDVQYLQVMNFSNAFISIYTCATDLNGVDNNPVETSVFITSSDPAIYIAPEIQHVLEGQSTSIIAAVFTTITADMLTIQWYHQAQLFDPDSDPRYTLQQYSGGLNLTVMNVDDSLLGLYEVVVSGGAQSTSDSINISYPTMPTASISPSSLTVSSGDSVLFTCQVGRSSILSVNWQLSNGQSLPEGALQNGNELSIAMATSDHAGVYECSVTNLAGTMMDTVELFVFYAPTTVIYYNGVVTSSNLVPVTLDHGAPRPTFVCQADGYLPPSVTWARSDGMEFNSGITTILNEGNRELRWNRDLEYTDSGQYECTATNNNGTSMVILNLLVQITPTITSIYPNAPVTPDLDIENTYLVPISQTGLVITCTGFGWPMPCIHWQRTDGQDLPSGVISDSTSVSSDSATITARLRWTEGGFQSADAGQYSCILNQSDTTITSRTVTLNDMQGTTEPPLGCMQVTEPQVDFQVRVLDTDCQTWDATLKGHVAQDFRDVIIQVVATECQCNVTREEIMILGDATCSRQIERGVFFRGRIKTSSVTETNKVFCVLQNWQQGGSLLQLNGRLQRVDHFCSLQAENSNSPECKLINTNDKLSENIYIGAIIGTIVLLVVVTVIFVTVFLLVKKKLTQMIAVPEVTGEEPISLGTNESYQPISLKIGQYHDSVDSTKPNYEYNQCPAYEATKPHYEYSQCPAYEATSRDGQTGSSKERVHEGREEDTEEGQYEAVF